MQDMPALRSGDIVPGEGISIFRLGATWAELRGTLIGAYAIQQRNGSFAVKTATLWFMIDETDQTVIQITAVGRFRGQVARQIGLGSTLDDVEEHLGRWSEDEDDCIVIAAVPGVCFEVGHVPGRNHEWQLHHAPIDYISVYDEHRGRVAA